MYAAAGCSAAGNYVTECALADKAQETAIIC